ncbi:MAG: S41 family peptidase [Gaiellales bacterium]
MRRAGGIAGVAVLLAGAFFLGLFLTRTQAPESATVTAASPPRAAASDLEPPLIDEVRRELADSYYRSVSPKVLAAPTIDGVLEALGDSNTDYLTAPEYDSLQNRTAKSYLGVGLTVEPARAGLLVTSALNGPARQAGIRSGDVIVRIDGRQAGTLSFEQSLAFIKGEKGTFVRLTIRRPNKIVKHFTVMRQEIAVPSLRTRLFTYRGTKLAHARLLGFREDTSRRLREATERLVARGASGLVLDLRDNPGGLLAQAVRTVSIFLKKGVVCTTGGLHQEQVVYEVSGRAAHPKLPLVILVNGASASAAEIVAAAFQDHERAVVVGRQTFGKASVQSIKPFWNGSALKLTTATYLTPSGVDLSERGVRPQVRASDRPLTRRDEALHAAAQALLKTNS